MMKLNTVKKITVVITMQHGNMYMLMSLLPKAKFTKKKHLCACFYYNYENIYIPKWTRKNIVITVTVS